MNDKTQHKQVLEISPPMDADPRADAEKEAFDSSSDYEKESRKKEHQRGEKLRDTLHKLVVVGVIIMGVLLIFGILVWAWHVLVTDNWHWLSTEQMREIQQIMSSVLLALVVSDYAKKYLK